jgi:hypothetical protein
MATAKKAKTRGSQKLSKKAAGSAAISKKVAALDKSALINGILIRGTPWPDIIKGSLTVKTSAAGGALSNLLNIPGAKYKSLELFPIGTPRPDQIKIKVDGKIKL